MPIRHLASHLFPVRHQILLASATRIEVKAFRQPKSIRPEIFHLDDNLILNSAANLRSFFQYWLHSANKASTDKGRRQTICQLHRTACVNAYISCVFCINMTHTNLSVESRVAPFSSCIYLSTYIFLLISCYSETIAFFGNH